MSQVFPQTGGIGSMDGSSYSQDLKKTQCSSCGKKYLHQRNLWRHVTQECGKEPKFQCPLCPHRSKRKFNLQKHIQLRHCKMWFCLCNIFSFFPLSEISYIISYWLPLLYFSFGRDDNYYCEGQSLTDMLIDIITLNSVILCW